MNAQVRLSRRDFLVTSAVMSGGMAIGILREPADAASVDAEPWSKAARNASELGPWVSIAPDDMVVVRVPTPESGNGVLTQSAMTVVEELQCDWSKVRAECISLNRDAREKNVYSAVGGLVSTFSGRSTTRERMQLLLQVGASARERLKTAAAQRWGVPVAEVEARNSVLTHNSTGRTLRFGEVAAAAARIQLQSEPAVKPQSEWTLLGKASPAKLNNPQIANGSAVFGIDVRLPGMLYAALMQSPVHGGKLKSYNFDAIKDMPGVRGVAVVDPAEPRKRLKAPLAENLPQSAIAVVADHYWQARKALETLPVEWDDGPGAQWKSTEQVNQAVLARLERAGDKVDKNEGDTLKAFSQPEQVVEATYLTPFCEHATMEPLNGTALVTGNRVELWHSAAISLQSFVTAAEEAGVPLENTHLHQTYIGGSFGRRLYGDDVRQVVAIAKKFPGRPVQVIWSREEMTRQGRYRHLTAARFRAGLDKEGLPAAMHIHVCRPGFGMAGIDDCAYTNGGTVPSVRIESSDVPLHVLWGAYRAPSYNSNAFFIESFVDECATAAGADPLEYRMRLLTRWPDPAWRKCLQEVALHSGWGKKLPKGQAQGVAISNWAMKGKPQSGTTVAVVAHVDVSQAGELEVLQLDLAFDCGRMLNRDAVVAEMEGGAIFGLNMSLNEELNILNGRIVEGNFDTYPMLRMADVPRKIAVHLGGLSGHDRFSEVGEPPVGPVGPAVANAVFRATGKRIRSMPFRKHDLRWS